MSFHFGLFGTSFPFIVAFLGFGFLSFVPCGPLFFGVRTHQKSIKHRRLRRFVAFSLFLMDWVLVCKLVFLLMRLFYYCRQQS